MRNEVVIFLRDSMVLHGSVYIFAEFVINVGVENDLYHFFSRIVYERKNCLEFSPFVTE